MSYDVECPVCHGIYYETTKVYEPGVAAHGGMLRMKEPYRSWSWSGFPEFSDTMGENLYCCDCHSPLVDHRLQVTLRLRPKQKPPKTRQEFEDDLAHSISGIT